MPKFATRENRPLIRQPLATTHRTVTYEGGEAWARDAKSDLYLLAVAMFVGGDDRFYESGDDRLARLRDLVRTVTADDPAWVAAFVPYLRDTMQMRSAPVVVACEYVAAGGPAGRRVVRAACQRADEPAEILAYWLGQYGRPIPKPIKRGVADAVQTLYTAGATLRYDGTGQAWRFGDVIDMVHPRPVGADMSTLFRYLLTRRHHPDGATDLAPPGPIVRRRTLDAMPVGDRRAYLAAHPDDVLDAAAGRWEWVAGWLADGKGMTVDVWETLIPRLGYMALLRNLRNFDDAGLSDEWAARVAARLVDPAEVARSRQLPLRFLAAYRAVAGTRWIHPQEVALGLTLQNVPRLDRKTLVMTDVSDSMVNKDYLSTHHPGWAKRNPGTMPWEHAALFGVALAARAFPDADLFAYGSVACHVPIRAGESLLRAVDGIRNLPSFATGTETVRLAAELVRQFGPYERVVVLTDEQAFASDRAATAALKAVPTIYTFNLAGYDRAWQPSAKGRFTFGGLTDAGFRAIAAIERSRSVDWATLFAAPEESRRPA